MYFIFIIINDFAFNNLAFNRFIFFALISFFFPVGEDDSKEAKNDFIDKWNKIWYQEINEEQSKYHEKKISKP